MNFLTIAVCPSGIKTGRPLWGRPVLLIAAAEGPNGDGLLAGTQDGNIRGTGQTGQVFSADAQGTGLAVEDHAVQTGGVIDTQGTVVHLPRRKREPRQKERGSYPSFQYQQGRCHSKRC